MLYPKPKFWIVKFNSFLNNSKIPQFVALLFDSVEPTQELDGSWDGLYLPTDVGGLELVKFGFISIVLQ